MVSYLHVHFFPLRARKRRPAPSFAIHLSMAGARKRCKTETVLRLVLKLSVRSGRLFAHIGKGHGPRPVLALQEGQKNANIKIRTVTPVLAVIGGMTV